MQRLLIATFILALAIGCKSPYELVRTGPIYPPLAKDSEVKIIGWQRPDSYEQVGIVDVGEYTLDRRISIAKQVARETGGDIIMPKISADPEETKKPGFLLQSFIILREKKSPSLAAAGPDLAIAPSTIPEKDEKSAIQPAAEPKKDYSKLPRAQFRILLSEISMLKGSQFQGSLYPVKYYTIPQSLKSVGAAERQLLMLSTRDGEKQVLLFVPKEKSRDFRKMIQNKRILNFVYTPLTVYRGKYPVLDYVDTIEK